MMTSLRIAEAKIEKKRLSAIPPSDSLPARRRVARLSPLTAALLVTALSVFFGLGGQRSGATRAGRSSGGGRRGSAEQGRVAGMAPLPSPSQGADHGFVVGRNAPRFDDLLQRFVVGPVVERRTVQILRRALREFDVADRQSPRHAHAGVIAVG